MYVFNLYYYATNHFTEKSYQNIVDYNSRKRKVPLKSIQCLAENRTNKVVYFH